MKEITVVSGKGGTGKTSITASFAVLAENQVITDCDVDAANLHLMLAPEVMEVNNYPGMPKAEIDAEKCTGCGLCETLCRYDAVGAGRVDKLLCEGCQVCYHACPAGAVRLVENQAGEWYLSRTRYGPFVHARLGVAQDNSGKLVARVRREARDLAEKTGRDLIITDGPPGIGCPVISALGGTDLALVVTEPTLSAIHDLSRVLELAEHFGVRAAVCINKWDINPDNCRAVEDICRHANVPVLGRIPYDPAFMAAALEKKPVVKMMSAVVNDIISLWDCVKKELGL